MSGALVIAAQLFLAAPTEGQLEKLFKPLPPAPAGRAETPGSLPEFDLGGDLDLGSGRKPLLGSGGHALLFAEIEKEFAAEHFDKVIATCDAALHVERYYRHIALILRYRAEAYAAKRQWEDALGDLAQAIKEQPDSAWTFQQRARIYTARGQWESAVKDLTRAVRLGAQDTKVFKLLNSLAWLRATCPDKRVRDGGEALELAHRACSLTNWQDAFIIDTLAAAYAETGNFERAAAFQEEAIWMTDVSPALRTEMAEKLTLFQRDLPYRDKAKK